MKTTLVDEEVPRQLYFEGQWKDAISGLTFSTFDPASGEVLAVVPAGSEQDVDAAVASAKSAFSGPWRRILPADRARILYRTATIIRREERQLSFVESLDSGKPLREAKGDVETAARYFEYYAGVADKLQGNTIPLGMEFVS
jgi:aldehyde dehydrogenase (NAD+)